MKTIVLALTMLGAVATAQAHQAPLRDAQPSLESFYGLQDTRPLAPAPRLGANACRGGACTLTGGPSGEPSQS